MNDAANGTSGSSTPARRTSIGPSKLSIWRPYPLRRTDRSMA